MSERSRSIAKSLISSLAQDLKQGGMEREDKIVDTIGLLRDLFAIKEAGKEDLERAEKLKNDGNAALSNNNVDEAIRFYQEAIELSPENPIYLANLSAALFQAEDFEGAKLKAELSVESDPKYIKGYIRLSNALVSLDKKKEAIEVLKKGLSINPENQILESQMSKLRAVPSVQSDAKPKTGPAGATSNPLASMMNNPEMMKMASEMMKNGSFGDLMKDPRVTALMKDPNQIQEIMKNLNIPK